MGAERVTTRLYDSSVIEITCTHIYHTIIYIYMKCFPFSLLINSKSEYSQYVTIWSRKAPEGN